MAAYQAIFQEQPTYLHAKVIGERTAANVLRFLSEAHQACLASGRANLLLEMDFRGPSLDPTTIFHVVSARSAEGANLRKIAYVESGARDVTQARFAETVATNRGVNVCFFPDLAAAARWLET